MILASQSPRRRKILKELGLKFKVIPSNIEEESGAYFSQARLKKLAISKVENVARRFKNGVVIGADTVVVLRNKIYGKPKDIEDAKRILLDLSGTTQYVWTAIAIKDIQSGKTIVRTVKSKVKMKKLTPAQIDMLASKNLDKAGAYAVQEDDQFIESIEGSFTNVVGFPVEILKQMLGKFGIMAG
ncbi:septum formation protein Maf [Candidatus Desantisbacteria bacterium CG07_land_8_20_14_0_80_39_15]|uniref:dTTP/UTP pyrophosphatase n=2 Tax=unclassified Candidatus Desantisiibacteriota TaxID=3106372 RepID=A0A2H9PBX7_9BACT|nr:MAG: septum formation protein Maf [Candidatus Desantisbacteria bacterium CG07_land_8_20_14_0_80_39_15]PIZ16476.1 MAG: septum formation protein Maf [Candidatus Desantisbacteria bacterium CG_4_10_14_0_8_um_filter_39_17]